jgi:hypothetical protein
LWRDFTHSDSQQLPDPSLGPIALYRFSKSPRHGKAQSRTLALPLHAEAKRRKVRARHPDAAVVDFAEIGGAQNSGAFRKAICRQKSPSATRL